LPQSRLIHLQIRSAWNPLLQSCIVFNTEDNKPNIVVTTISDAILLIAVLVGLHREGGGVVFPLGRLLWNQVGLGQFPFAVVLLNFLGFQGIIWLAIATVTEALPMASLAFFCTATLTLT
jgi:hypothetical protein